MTMSSSRSNLENYLIPLEEIKRATENFSQQRCIGGGGFGAVYKGQLSAHWQHRTTAIKRLGRNQGEREFRSELDMIFKFHHKNIIAFVGYCDEDKEMIIVYEYASKGSLDHHLADPNKMRSITWTQRLKICIGSATGLNYLHSGLGEHNRVIHRDVKSANILLDDDLVAKICDFGLSRSGLKNVPNTQLYTTVAGTQFYMDPTYLESRILRKESDVYSFGVVLFEMVSGMLAYSKRKIEDDREEIPMTFVRRCDQKELHKIIDPNIRFQIDTHSFNVFKEIAYRCISLNIHERPTMDSVIERLEESLKIQESEGSYTDFVLEELGFKYGKPVAAVIIYKCLLDWNYLEAETTSVFDQIIQIFDRDINDHDKMAYWLSVASTLLFLVHKSLKPPPPTSILERMKMVLLPFMISLELAETEVELKVVQQVEGKYPAFLFKQQLTACVEKFYDIIYNKLKEELASLLTLCIEAPRTSVSEYRGKRKISSQADNHWKGIVDCLNTPLKSLKENFVPPIIVRKIYEQIFSYINEALFNSVLLRSECCTLFYGEYVKSGLAELELWCCEAKEEYASSAWDELKHTRQAMRFLVIHQKNTLSFDEITDDLCPDLSIQQLHQICTRYRDERLNSQSVSQDVYTNMWILMKDSKYVTNSSNLLKDNSSIPMFVDDILTSLQVEDYEGVLAVIQLANCGAIHLKTGHKRIVLGLGIP